MFSGAFARYRTRLPRCDERRAPFERLAETLPDADRRRVSRPDQADHVRLVELGDAYSSARRAPSTHSLWPRPPGQAPRCTRSANLGIEQADAADEGAGSRAPRCKSPPRIRAAASDRGTCAICRASRRVSVLPRWRRDSASPRDRRTSRVRVEVGIAKHSQAQALGLERDHPADSSRPAALRCRRCYSRYEVKR